MGKVALSGVSVLLGARGALRDAVLRHVCVQAADGRKGDRAGSQGRRDRSVSSGDPVLSLALLHTGPSPSGGSSTGSVSR